MKILVCIKQVPDSAQIRVHPVTNTIMRQGVPTIVNPYDLFSLEEALRLRDKLGGEVTVLTMGPPMASEALRKTLAIGADRAVLLTDRAFAAPTRSRRPMPSPRPSARSRRPSVRKTSSLPESRQSTATPRRSDRASPNA